MSYWDTIFGPDTNQQRNALDLQKQKLDFANLLSQQSAQSQLGYGVPDPKTGITWNGPAAPTGNYQQLNDDGSFTTNSLSSAPPQAQNMLADSFKQTASENANLLRQAAPSQFMSADVNRAVLLPQLKAAGMTDAQIQAYLLDPKSAGEANAKSAFPETPDSLRVIDGLKTKIAQLGAGTPEAKPYEDQLAKLNYIPEMDPLKRSEIEAQTADANAGAALKRNTLSLQSASGPVTSLNGADYLATLKDQNYAALVKARAEGRQPMPSPRSPTYQRAAEDVLQYDPGANAQTIAARGNFIKQEMDPNGKTSQSINALNTASDHLGDLADDVGLLHNQTGLIGRTVLNPIKNKYATASGENQVTNFVQNRNAVASELRKVYAGQGGGNLQELEEWQGSYGENGSPEQLYGGLDKGIQLMMGKAQAIADQRNAALGTHVSAMDVLSPSARVKIIRAQNVASSYRQQPVQGPAQGTPQGQAQPQQSPTAPPGAKTIQNGWYYDATGKPLGRMQ